MAEESLGSAVLHITVNSTTALGQLQKFQQDASTLLASIQVGIDAKQSLDRFQQEVTAAGAKAGKAASGAIKAAVSKLNFKDVQEALSFGGALDGTIKDLRDYKRALEDLRETTKTTSPDFQQLNDLIYQLGNQIKNETRSTTELARALQQLRDASANQKLKEAVASHKEGEKAARAQAKANRELADSFLGVAKRSGSFALRAPGAIAKGVGGAINLGKGAINAGRAGYDIGAELGIFEAPKDGPLKQSISAIIDRFRFLGEQAKTTRGQILRLIEGVGAAEAFNQISQNTDLLRTSLDGVSVASRVAEGSFSALAKAGQFFANITPDNAFFSPLKQLLQDAASLEKLGAGVAGGSDFFAQFGVEAGKAALDQIDSLTSLIAALPPELAAVAGGVVGMYAAFEGDTALKQLQEIANRLKLVGTEALNVDKALSEAIAGQAKADFDALPKQLPAFRERGLQRLDVDNDGLKAARDYTQGLVEAAEKASLEFDRIKNFGTFGQALEGTLGVLTEITQEEQLQSKLAQEARQAQLDQIRDAGRLADAERQRTKELEEQTREIARAREIGRGREIGRLNAVGIDGKLPNGRFAPGSPGAIAARNKRLRDAGSNALIGGAFPLLFGQGLGAAAGGGIGGGAGGLLGGQFGFGLSLIGTALGTQFDEALKKGQALADALRDPIGQLGALSEASLLSSKQIERAAKSLVESGRTAEAAALVRADLFEQYGSVESAKALAGATDELGRSWSRLGISLAAIASGPLAKAAQVLNSVLGGAAGSEDRISNGAFRQRVNQIEKEFGREAARSVVQDQFRQPKGFSLLGGLDQSAQERANKVALKNARDRGLITAQEKKIADDVTKAKEAQAALDATSYRLITAQVQGQKRNVLALRETQLEQQLIVDKLSLSPEQFAAQARKANSELHQIREELADLPVEGSLGYAAEQAEKLNRELNKAILGTSDYNNLLQEQINTNTRLREASKTPTQRFADEIAAASRLAEIESQIFIERQRRDKNLGSTGVQVLQQLASFDAARRAEQVAQANLRTDPFNTDLQNTAREAARAVELSAAKAKNDLIEAFKAAKESVRSISRSLEDSKLQLGQLQNTGASGLNQFLPRQFVQQRQEQLNADLRPLAESIARRLGVQFSVSGTLEQRNAQLIDLIRSDRAETRLREDIFDTRQDLDRATNDLAEVNRSLVQINGDLASATTTLANKDWNVYVNVPGGSYSTDSRLQGVYN